MGKYINKYLSDNAVFYYRKNRVGGKDLWADKKESSKLQHNKFMIVNHYLGNSKDSIYDYNVYVATANANDFNAVNSGILIRGNVDLYDAYNRYFMKLYAFYDNYTNFKCSVRSIGDENKVPTNPEDVYYPEYNHADNTLNYVEEDNDSKITFQAYFFPVPEEITESWDTAFNPVAKLVEKMILRPKQKKYIKINAYHWNGKNKSQFGYRLYHKIRYSLDSSKNHIMYVINKDSSSDDIGDEVIKRKIKHWKDDSDRKATFYYKFGERTHAKNFIFAFSTLDSDADKDIYKREYYVITGSVNPKRFAYTERGNTQIVIREPFTDHPIYNAFKDCFYDAYDLGLH